MPPRLGDGISVGDGLLVLFDVMQFLSVRWKHGRSLDGMVKNNTAFSFSSIAPLETFE